MWCLKQLHTGFDMSDADNAVTYFIIPLTIKDGNTGAFVPIDKFADFIGFYSGILFLQMSVYITVLFSAMNFLKLYRHRENGYEIFCCRIVLHYNDSMIFAACSLDFHYMFCWMAVPFFRISYGRKDTAE